MKILIKSTFIIFQAVLLSFQAQAQAQSEVDRILYRADRLFEIGNYKEALPLLQEAMKAGANDPVTHYQAGVSYAKNPDFNEQLKAIPHLEAAMKQKNDKVPNDVYFYAGKVYHKNTDFRKSLDAYGNYKKTLTSRDADRLKEVNREMEIGNNALFHISRARIIDIQSIGNQVNSEYTEYNPIITADESMLAFTALRPKKGGRRGELVEEVIVLNRLDNGKWDQGEVVDLGNQYNVGTAGLSADGQRMLIFIGSPGNTGNLFYLDRTATGWSKPVSLGAPINSNHLESTASLTPDGKTIYFASNRPGGLGGMDIYKSEKLSNGRWGEPVNLGPTVNTKYDDDAPFIHPDGKTLYFTSDGHDTMGGKDIFKTIKEGDKWSKPQNLGYPINTPANDNYFTLTADGRRGYFSSDRPGGKGGQDIYFFDMPEDEANVPLTLVKGRILAGETLEPVPTKIKVVDMESSEKVDYVYNPNPQNGNYLIIFPPGKNYDLIIESEGYMPYTINIDVPNQAYFYELYQQIHLRPIMQFDVVVGQEVSVKNAFFDSGKEFKVDPKRANEAMLVKNDSLDLFDLMDAIIAAEDSVALEYLLELMYDTNPIDDVDFEAMNSEEMEIAQRNYYYDESDEEKLEKRVIDGETIYSLPTLKVSEEAKKRKEQKARSGTFDKTLLEKGKAVVYFDVDASDLKQEYHSALNELLQNLKNYDDLGIEISGYASADGDAEYNRKLSNQRATEVLNYFNYKGVVRRRIKAKGYGAAETSSAGNKRESRRVEVKLIDLNNYQ